MQGVQNLNGSGYKKLSKLIPSNHILKKVERCINFNFIYSITRKLYAKHFGRPSIDPTLFFKMQLIGYLFGISSDRELCREIKFNLAYRWFCKLGINDKIPHHSSLTRIRNRLGVTTYRKIFETLIKKWMKLCLIAGKTLLTDASIVEANASIDSLISKENSDINSKDSNPDKKKENTLIKLM